MHNKLYRFCIRSLEENVNKIESTAKVEFQYKLPFTSILIHIGRLAKKGEGTEERKERGREYVKL